LKISMKLHSWGSCLVVCSLALGLTSWTNYADAADIYVSPNGLDSNSGSVNNPVATLPAAQELARTQSAKGQPVTVHLRGGKYNLASTLTLTPEDSGTATAPVIYQADNGEEVIVTSGEPLTGLKWVPYKNGILQTTVPDDFTTDQLFVNGKPQIMARYPNYDPAARNFNGDGKLDDVLSPQRLAGWSDPEGGFIHSLHANEWGGLSYQIIGKNSDGTLKYEGGWQNNRPSGMNKNHVMVENIFEELDAPGEWYLNAKTHTLYFYPPVGLDLINAQVEGVRLPILVEFQGTAAAPVKSVFFKNLVFTEAARTFMQTKEPLLRTDWAIYRGGAILFTGAESCSITDCTLRQLGGNAIFVDGYDRKVTISGCHLYDLGGNGVAFIGSVSAVRNPLRNYNMKQTLADIDQTPGPQSPDYPANCLVDDCLIHNTGRSVNSQAGDRCTKTIRP
jgi:hypothetical protein